MKIAVVGNDLRSVALSRVLATEGHDVYLIAEPRGALALAPTSVKALPLPAREGPKWAQMRRKSEIIDVVTWLGPTLVVCLHVESSDAGLVDELKVAGSSKGFTVFGADQRSAHLEVSKKHGLAVARQCGLKVPATSIVEQSMRSTIQPPFYPCVIKADGLAGGRGTQIIIGSHDFRPTLESAPEGDVLLQEFISGEEIALSLLVADGEVRLLDVNFEYKREFCGDVGPNTPGMGTVCTRDPGLPDISLLRILVDLPEYLRSIFYNGPIDVNMIISQSGTAHFMEFTTRFGDPELCTELLLLENVGMMLLANSRGSMHVDRREGVTWAAGVVARGELLPAYIDMNASVDAFHDGEVGTSCCAFASDSVSSAVSGAYRMLGNQSNMSFRRDIGHNVERRLQRLREVVS